MHFCMFLAAGFHRNWCPCHCPQRKSTAANSSSPHKSGRVAESPHLQASLLEIPLEPQLTAQWTEGPQSNPSRVSWLKALWWKREGGICTWSMFPHTPFSPEAMVLFCQPSAGCVWGIPYWVAVRGFSCKFYLKSQRTGNNCREGNFGLLRYYPKTFLSWGMVLEILHKDAYTFDQKYYKNTLAIIAFCLLKLWWRTDTLREKKAQMES